MNTPLILGLIALVFLIGANPELTNSAIGDLQRGQLPTLPPTAFATGADRKAAIGAGFGEHLAKPADTAPSLRTVAIAIART